MNNRFHIDLTLPIPIKDNENTADLKTIEDVIIRLNTLNRDYKENRKVLLDFMNLLNCIQYHFPDDKYSFEDLDPTVFQDIKKKCNKARDMLFNMNMELMK